MNHSRTLNGFRAGRLVRPALVLAALGLVPAVATSPASAQPVAGASALRGPLFFRPGQERAAAELLRLVDTARTDGLDPRRYRSREVHRLVRAAWGGNPQAIARADRALADLFVRYAQDLRRAPNIGVIYVDNELRPQAPSAATLLGQAAAAPDVAAFIRDMGWMHPYYAPLRRHLVEGRLDSRRQALVRLNLERVRSLPAGGRYVLVNSAAQRLFMVDNGQTVDMMRVVVGKPIHPTPMMAGLIRFTTLRPFWNVPSDLAAERIAPNVVKQGVPYLRQKGYQVLSDWSERPRLVNPASIDWQAVAAGRKEIRVRQLPGPSNSMGDMKFMFPNAQGIYLHDSPQEDLFDEASRMFSAGCVRLEAAPRLARWLYGRPLRARGATPEQKVPLGRPVPVYLTYLTVVPSGSELAYFDDIYRWDQAKKQMARGRRG